MFFDTKNLAHEINPKTIYLLIQRNVYPDLSNEFVKTDHQNLNILIEPCPQPIAAHAHAGLADVLKGEVYRQQCP